MALTAAVFSCEIVPPVHAPSVWKSMSNTLGATAAPPVYGVPVMLTLMPPVDGKRQLPFLSFAAESWYCHRALVAGFQHAPKLVLHGTGAAQPAVEQLACAGAAARMTGTNDSSMRTDVPIARRFMRSSSCDTESDAVSTCGADAVNSVGRNAWFRSGRVIRRLSAERAHRGVQ